MLASVQNFVYSLAVGMVPTTFGCLGTPALIACVRELVRAF